MKKKNENCQNARGRLHYIYVTLMIFIFICMFLYGYTLLKHKEKGISLKNGWTLYTEDTVENNYELKSVRMPKADYTCKIERNLPVEYGDRDALCFKTQSLAVRVFIDDEKVYEYGYDLGKINSTPGDYMHYINLPSGSEGKKITIEMYFPYKNASFMINDITIVDDKTSSIQYLRQRIIPVLVCLFVLFLTLIAIICEIAIFRRIYGNPCLIYMSLFLLCLSVWSLTQVQIIPVLLKPKYYYGSLPYIMLSLMPIFLVMYVNERFIIKKTTLAKVMKYLTLIVCVAIQLLNVTGIYEYASSLIFTHIMLVSAAVYLVYASTQYRSIVRNQSVRRFLAVSISLMVIFGVLDVINSYLCILSDYSFFTRFGILILSISIFVDTLDSSLNIVVLGENSNLNRIRAYTDALTGLDNRMSLDEEMNNIRNIIQYKNEYAVMVFDINNLKQVNDNMGHEAGDKMIIEGSRLISRASMSIGKVYRYGGDEFVVLIYDDVENKINTVIENYKKYSYARNEELEMNIQIAYGSHIHPIDSEQTVEDIFRVADEKMYECKKKMKAVQPEQVTNV